MANPALLPDIQSKLYLALVCVCCAVPCSVLGWRDRVGPGRLLSLATIAYAVGLPALLFKDFLPRPPTVLLGNMLVTGAMGLFWHVTARLCGGTRLPFWSAAVAPAAWAASWSLPGFRASLDVRIAVSTVLTGTLAGLAMVELARRRFRGLPHRLLFGIGAVYVAVCAMRCGLALAGRHVGESPFWVTVADLNVVGYIALWPALCLVLLNQRWIEEEAERGATDELSGLLNRGGFLRRAEAMRPGTLLLFDIDRFKEINDGCGHARGDDAIRAFAALLRRELGTGGMIGRLGGDEFAVLVADRGAAWAEAAAERVRTAFAIEVLPGGIRATVSVGMAHPSAERWDTVENRLARADQALYRAKRGGRNRIERAVGEVEAGGRVLAAVE